MAPGYLSEIHALVGKWSRLGVRELRNGTLLIGHTPSVNIDSYLHELYGPLDAIEISELEDVINREFPLELREFFLNHNGCNLFAGLIGVYGLKKVQSRTNPEIALSYPYDIIIPNKEWGKLSPSRNGVVIKRYTDGSVVFSEPDGRVVRVDDSGSFDIMYRWTSVGKYLVDECKRLEKFFDPNGRIMVDRLDAVKSFH